MIYKNAAIKTASLPPGRSSTNRSQAGTLARRKCIAVPDDGAKTPLMRSQLARGGKSDIEPGHEFSGVLGFTYNFTDQSTQYQNIRADEVIE